MAPALSRNQSIFANTLAQRTGLSPALISAWIVAEEPAGANAPVGHSDQNWLNIGNTDSKWYGGGGSWRDPVTAANNSAAWLQGRYSVPGFGKAAPGIQAFARTAGQPLGTQISALQHSGWASSGYPDLPKLVSQFGGQAARVASPGASPAAAAPQAQAGTALDGQAFANAQRAYQLGQVLRNQPRSPFDIGPRASIGTSNPLLSILPSRAPQPGDYTKAASTLSGLAGGLAVSPHPAAGPLGKVTVAPGANRPGVGLNPRVTNFVSLLAGNVGQPITIGTGTNHNRMTVDGSVSDHWAGNAADLPVPVDSAQGDMIAGRALMLAGVPRAQARQMAQKGGLYTLTPSSGPLKGTRVQVIWKTYDGGDHHNHVHIGIRPA